MSQASCVTSLTPELYCSDINISLDFYVNILGFKIQYQREEERFAMLEREGARIMLEEFRVRSESDKTRVWLAGPLEPPFGRGMNLEIRTVRVNELYERVRQSHARIFLPIEEKWYRANTVETGNRQFIILDPDGYLLRFAEHLGEREI